MALGRNPRIFFALACASTCVVAGVAFLLRDPRGATAAGRSAPDAIASTRAFVPAQGTPPDLARLFARTPFAFRDRGGRTSVDRPEYRAVADHDGIAFSALREADESRAPEEATLRIRTASVTRGGRPIVARAIASVDAHGDHVVERGAVIERFRADEAGVEQTWTFDREPEGEGDLVVELRTSGLDVVAVNASGIHFASASGLGARYGHATLVDASGTRTSIDVVPGGAGLLLRVPADVIDASVYPIVLDPVIGPEFAIDQPVIRGAVDPVGTPAVAFGAGMHLVVWSEASAAGANVYGMRISSAGVQLDQAAFVVSAAPYEQWAPDVAFDGTGFVVVWQDRRSNVSNDVYGARVSTEGVVLDPAGIPICVAAADQVIPRIASGGGGLFVVWEDRSVAAADLYGARLSTAGVVADVPALPIVTSASASTVPRISFDGTNFLVAFLDQGATNGDVAFTRVSTAGAPLDGAGIRLTDDAATDDAHFLAWNGTHHLVAWTRQGAADDVVHARISPDGTVLDPAPVPTVGGTGGQRASGLTASGQGFLVVYHDSATASTIAAIRVGSNGAPSPSGGFPIGTSTANISAASHDGTNVFVVHAADVGSQLVATRVAPDDALLDAPRIAVSRSWNEVSSMVVAAGRNQFLVVYTDRGSADLYAARLSGAGAVLDPVGIPVEVGASVPALRNVLFDGTQYTIAMSVGTNLFLARVSPSGLVTPRGDPLDPTVFPLLGSSSPSGVAMATNGTRSIVTVDNYFAAPPFFERRLEVNLLSPTGAVLTTTTVATNESTPDPRAASDGSGFLVVYHSGGNILGRRFTADGAASGASFTISAAANSQADPAVVFDGTYYVVAWADRRNTTFSEIYAAHVATNGVVQETGGVRIAGVATADRYGPTLHRAGGGVYVTWKDYRTGSDALYGARLDSFLGSMDGAGVELQADTDGFGAVAAGNLGGRLLVAYGLPDADAALRTHAFGRVVCVDETDVTCNGVDDDCDGQADEDFFSEFTMCGTGACANYGSTACNAGVLHDSCAPGPATGSDSDCDLVDDDCDGSLDEAFLPTQSSCGLGVCSSSGVATCSVNGLDDTCVPGLPTGNDGNCNGVDEDCDGRPDDGYVGVTMSCGPGICATAGTTRCTSGTILLVCRPPAGAPSDDDCDGIDDDCDQIPDDDFAQAAPRCGIGACQRTGTIACVQGSVQTTPCTPGSPIGPDTTCDGIDDDCNGVVDDGVRCVADAGAPDGGDAPPSESGCSCSVAGRAITPPSSLVGAFGVLAIVALLARRRVR